MSLALAAFFAAPAAPRVQRARPDLVVKLASLSSRPWVFRGEDSLVKWLDRTANIGRGPARGSKTGLAQLYGAWRRVPRLLHNDWSTGKGRYSHNFPAADWQYGSHKLLVCADITDRVDEKREGNNCRRAKPSLLVIPWEFSGSVSASWSDSWDEGVTESVEGEVTFQYAGASNRRTSFLFNYRAIDGSLTFTTQGTDPDGCTWSGTGETEPEVNASAINLEFVFAPTPSRTYTGSGLARRDFEYTVTRTCVDEDGVPEVSEFLGPVLGDFLQMDRHTFDDPGFTSLTGRYIDLGSGGDWLWDLAAEDP